MAINDITLIDGVFSDLPTTGSEKTIGWGASIAVARGGDMITSWEGIHPGTTGKLITKTHSPGSGGFYADNGEIDTTGWLAVNTDKYVVKHDEAGTRLFVLIQPMEIAAFYPGVGVWPTHNEETANSTAQGRIREYSRNANDDGWDYVGNFNAILGAGAVILNDIDVSNDGNVLAVANLNYYINSSPLKVCEVKLIVLERASSSAPWTTTLTASQGRGTDVNLVDTHHASNVAMSGDGNTFYMTLPRVSVYEAGQFDLSDMAPDAFDGSATGTAEVWARSSRAGTITLQPIQDLNGENARHYLGTIATNYTGDQALTGTQNPSFVNADSYYQAMPADPLFWEHNSTQALHQIRFNEDYFPLLEGEDITDATDGGTYPGKKAYSQLSNKLGRSGANNGQAVAMSDDGKIMALYQSDSDGSVLNQRARSLINIFEWTSAQTMDYLGNYVISDVNGLPNASNCNPTNYNPSGSGYVNYEDNGLVTSNVASVIISKKPTENIYRIAVGESNNPYGATLNTQHLWDNAKITVLELDKVSAADTLPPDITLLGYTPITTYQGFPYTDAGVTASDVQDGDLSGSVITVDPVDLSTAGSYTITYNVSDAAGNAATEVTRTVNVVTAPAPVITVAGVNPMSLSVGIYDSAYEYQKGRVTATDALGTSLNDDIVTNDPVDITTIGSYTITYSVIDAAGNTGEATRTVNVYDVDSDGDGILDEDDDFRNRFLVESSSDTDYFAQQANGLVGAAKLDNGNYVVTNGVTSQGRINVRVYSPENELLSQTAANEIGPQQGVWEWQGPTIDSIIAPTVSRVSYDGLTMVTADNDVPRGYDGISDDTPRDIIKVRVYTRVSKTDLWVAQPNSYYPNGLGYIEKRPPQGFDSNSGVRDPRQGVTDAFISDDGLTFGLYEDNVATSGKGSTGPLAPLAEVYEFNGATWSQKGPALTLAVGSDSIGDKRYNARRMSASADALRIVTYNAYTLGNGADIAIQVHNWDSVSNAYVSILSDLFPVASAVEPTGVALSADGLTIVIANSSAYDINGNSAGAAWVYRYDGAAWNLLGTPQSDYDNRGYSVVGDVSLSANDMRMGYSVAISGDGNRIVLGATYFDAPGTSDVNAGSFIAYDWDGAQWVVTPIYNLANITSEQVNGSSVAVSRDGTHVAVTQQNYNGELFLFYWDGSQWVHDESISPIIAPGYQHGYSTYGAFFNFDFSGDGNTFVYSHENEAGDATDTVFRGRVEVFDFDPLGVTYAPASYSWKQGDIGVRPKNIITELTGAGFACISTAGFTSNVTSNPAQESIDEGPQVSTFDDTGNNTGYLRLSDGNPLFSGVTVVPNRFGRDYAIVKLSDGGFAVVLNAIAVSARTNLEGLNEEVYWWVRRFDSVSTPVGDWHKICPMSSPEPTATDNIVGYLPSEQNNGILIYPVRNGQPTGIDIAIDVNDADEIAMVWNCGGENSSIGCDHKVWSTIISVDVAANTISNSTPIEIAPDDDSYGHQCFDIAWLKDNATYVISWRNPSSWYNTPAAPRFQAYESTVFVMVNGGNVSEMKSAMTAATHTTAQETSIVALDDGGFIILINDADYVD